MTPADLARSLSEAELRQELRSMIGFVGDKKVTAKSLAKQFGVSEAYLSDVLHGRRGIADKLAGAMGYTREVRFVPSIRAELAKER